MGKIILGIILLFLIVLLFVPIGAEFRYDRAVCLWGRIAGIRFLILPKGKPQKKKKKKNKNKDDEEAPQSEGAKNDSEHKKERVMKKLLSLKKTLALIKELLGVFFRYSQKRIRIQKLEISIRYGAEDAAKTAISVGGIWSALYGVLPLIDHLFMVKSHHFSVEPSYQTPTFSVRAEGIAKTRLAHIILVGIVLVIRYLRFQLKEKKAVKNHE